MTARSSRNKEVDRYFAQVDPSQRAIARALHAVVRQVGPQLREEIKWGVPCFMGQRLVCAIAPQSDHTNLQFYFGAALRDAHHLLEGTGKSLRHVKFYAADEVRVARLRPLLREAIAYDSR